MDQAHGFHGFMVTAVKCTPEALRRKRCAFYEQQQLLQQEQQQEKEQERQQEQGCSCDGTSDEVAMEALHPNRKGSSSSTDISTNSSIGIRMNHAHHADTEVGISGSGICGGISTIASAAAAAALNALNTVHAAAVVRTVHAAHTAGVAAVKVPTIAATSASKRPRLEQIHTFGTTDSCTDEGTGPGTNVILSQMSSSLNNHRAMDPAADQRPVHSILSSMSASKPAILPHHPIGSTRNRFNHRTLDNWNRSRPMRSSKAYTHPFNPIMVSLLSDDDDTEHTPEHDLKLPADPTRRDLDSAAKPPIQAEQEEQSTRDSAKDKGRTLLRLLLPVQGQTKRPKTTSSSTALVPDQSVSKEDPGNHEYNGDDSITHQSTIQTTRRTTSTFSSPHESHVGTLGSWLKNASSADIERLNQELLEEANAAHSVTLTSPPPPRNDDETNRIQTNNLLQNSDLRALTKEQLQKLNEEALRRAMMGPVLIDRCYTFREFQALLEKAADHFLDLHELEESRAVRKANRTVERSDSTNQTRAQYGRTMPTAAEFLLGTIGNLGVGKVFCDIGHGVGNLPLQAAFTYGCESRGIEMVGDRHDIAECLVDFFKRQHQLISDQEGEMRSVGHVRLRHGSLEDSVHRAFLTDTVDLLYCNNYNGVFSVRANDRNVGWCLDDYIAGLLTQLKVGAKLVTLYEIQRLPLSLQEANEVRLKNGLSVSPIRDGSQSNKDAVTSNDDNHQEDTLPSFYTLDVMVDPGGDDKLSFTQNSFTYYVYTRVGSSTATFLCHERSCVHNNTPLLAFETIPLNTNALVGGSASSSSSLPPDTRLVPVTSCPYCKNDTRSVRRRKR